MSTPAIKRANTGNESEPVQITASAKTALDLIRAMRGFHANKAASAITEQLKRRYPNFGPETEVSFTLTAESIEPFDKAQLASGLEVEETPYEGPVPAPEPLVERARRERVERNKQAPRERKPKAEPRSCACGCAGMTGGGTFLPGHDSRFKSGLLKRIDKGDKDALDTLLGFPSLYPADKARERFDAAQAEE